VQPVDETSLSALRLLGLRRFAGFERVDVDDLAKLLAATTERTLPSGTHLAKRGAPLLAAYFVIEGTLRVSLGDRSHDVGPNETAGMVDMIAGRPEGLDIDCVTDAVVLELENADFIAFNAENFDMLEALLRAFSARVLTLSPLEGSTQPAQKSPRRTTSGFVERLLFLHGLEAFGALGAETTADLAAALEEHQPLPGVIVPKGHPTGALYVVVEGALRFGMSEIQPGGVFGLLHSVAQSPLPFDLVATNGTKVLTCRREIVADLLEDNVAFTLAWLQKLAQRLLELGSKHTTTESEPVVLRLADWRAAPSLQRSSA